MKKSDVIDALQCDSCDIIIDPEEQSPEPLYDCNNCGTAFLRSSSYTGDNHQCPDCLKFASKRTDKGCPECEDGELFEVRAVKDDQEDWVLEDDVEEWENEDNSE